MFDVRDVVQFIVALVLLVIAGYALAQAWTAWRRRRAWIALREAEGRQRAEGHVISRYDATSASAEHREEARA